VGDPEDRTRKGEAKAVWDAVDVSPDLGRGQNVLKIFEMAIRRNRPTI